MSDGYTLDEGELSRASGTLGTVATGIESHVAPIRARPDAGRSSAEVADAFGRLAQELQAFSEAVSNLAGDVQRSQVTYLQTDRAEAAEYQHVLPR